MLSIAQLTKKERYTHNYHKHHNVHHTRMKHISPTRTYLSRFITISAAVLVTAFGAQPIASTLGNFQERIDRLKDEVGGLNSEVKQLRIEGDTLAEAIAALKRRIAGLEQKIASNQAKKAELEALIVQAKADIVKRNEALVKNLRMMYLEGEVSSLEKVASSDSISEFVDKQEYRNKIQERIKTAVNEIKELKRELERQQTRVERLIQDDIAMKADINREKAAQAELLAETRGKESAYKEKVAAKKEQISDLQAQQAAAIAAAAAKSGSYFIGGSGSGGYPWATARFPCAGGDPWGMCFRQCVSYAAWKVASTGRHMPYWGGIGNANQWPGNAEASKPRIPTGTEPRVGSVAVMMSGPYGHVMYVEEVLNGGSQIRISEYNYSWNGTYSERVQSSAGLIYIYF